MKFPDSGVYAITRESFSAERLLNEVEAALRGGVKVIQFRCKTADNRESTARKLLTLCHHYQVPLIINDNVDLAAKTGADGVHLGRDDCPLHEARKILGQQAIIGVSCYDDLGKAIAMEKAGADYIAFGRFFASGTKPLASQACLSTLVQAKSVLNLPIVAIGGITTANATPLLNSGADLLAVIGGIFNQPDPYQASLELQQLFNHNN